MRTAFAAAALAAALLLASGPAAAEEPPGVEVSGTVVDGAGKPVAGADVGDFFAVEGDRVFPFRGTKSGPDGAFKLTVQSYGRPFALLAYDAERKRSGMVRLGPEGARGSLLLSLFPVFRVRGRFTCKALGGKPEWTMVYAYTSDGKVRVAQCDSTDAEFSLLLPDGAWSLNMYGTDINGVDRTVEPKKGKLDLDLGAVEMEATFLARHYGKPLPAWTVSDARGVKTSAQIADYKGKWLLVEFWGFW
jgi:hypothetical protein